MSKEFLISNFKSLITTIIQGEEACEKPRIFLYRNPGFNYDDFCSRIDIDKMGIITMQNLQKFLFAHSLNIPNKLLEILISHFGSNNDTFLSYDDLKLFLYPKTYISSRYEKGNSDEINFDLEQIACKVLLNEFILINEVSKCLDRFYNDDTFVVYDLIKLLSGGNDCDFINENMIENFCYDYNVEISHNELKILLYYLRCDSERRISYTSLKHFFKRFIIGYDIDLKNNSCLDKNSLCKNLKQQEQQKFNESSTIVKYTKIDLKKLLLSLMKYEKVMHMVKIKVYNNEEIIPIEVFYLFDEEDANRITKDNFKNVLYNNFSLSPTNEEINLIYHHYSGDEEALDFDEFKSLLTPFNMMYEKDKMITLDDNEISPKTKSDLVELFKVILTFEKKIEELKLRYVNDKNFSPYEQFLVLRGPNNAKKIDKRMIYNFLIENCQNGEIIDQLGLDLIYNRFDIDHDNLISYEDFVETISPIENYSL